MEVTHTTYEAKTFMKERITMNYTKITLAAAVCFTAALNASQAPSSAQERKATGAASAQTAAQPQKETTRKQSFLKRVASLTAGGLFIGFGVFAGLKAKDEYDAQKGLAGQAVNTLTGIRDGAKEVVDEARAALGGGLRTEARKNAAPAKLTANPSLTEQVSAAGSNLAGEAKNLFEDGKSFFNGNKSPLKTTGWATASICSLFLGLRLMYQAVKSN